MPPILLLLLLLLITGSLTVEAVIIQVQSGRTKCLSDELRLGSISHLTYRIAGGNLTGPTAISARVSGPQGEEVREAEAVAEAGEFAFQASQGGKYTACFWTPRFQLGAVVDLDFEWNIGAHVHKSNANPGVAQKGDIDVITMELKKMEDSVKEIHKELIFLRERDVETQKLNEDISSRMHSLSLLSLVVCLGVAGMQIWHLKAFFKREKIL